MTTPTATRADLRRQLLDALAAVDPNDHDWRGRAACRGVDTGVFFPPNGRADLQPAALRICRPCPVKLACLRLALELAPVEHTSIRDAGIYGGTTPRQRRRIRPAWTARKAADAAARAAALAKAAAA